MSIRQIPEPTQIDYHADHEAQRRRMALAKIPPEDVLALAMETLSEAPLEGHALQPLILWLLDRAWAPGDGGVLWDRLRTVVTAAVERALDETLADNSAWEE